MRLARRARPCRPRRDTSRRLVADRAHHLDELVERLGDLAVDAGQVLAQPHGEVAALERRSAARSSRGRAARRAACAVLAVRRCATCDCSTAWSSAHARVLVAVQRAQDLVGARGFDDVRVEAGLERASRDRSPGRSRSSRSAAGACSGSSRADARARPRSRPSRAGRCRSARRRGCSRSIARAPTRRPRRSSPRGRSCAAGPRRARAGRRASSTTTARSGRGVGAVCVARDAAVACASRRRRSAAGPRTCALVRAGARRVHGPAVQLDEPLHEAEAEAEAAGAVGRRALLHEHVEDRAAAAPAGCRGRCR